MITSVTVRNQEWDVKYNDHGWEPDTNAHEIDWEFVDKDAPSDLTAEEDEAIYLQLARIGYERLDDDVIWLAPDAIRRSFEFRQQHREAWLTGPLVINNAICSHWLQQAGLLPTDIFGDVSLTCMDHRGWSDAYCAHWLQEQFVAAARQNQWRRLCTGQSHWIPCRTRYSINAVSWFGEDMRAAIPQLPGKYEESVLTETVPADLGRSICIDGNTLVSHLAYFVQRNHPAYPIDAIWESYANLIV